MPRAFTRLTATACVSLIYLHPGDADEDVLPYPAPAVRQKKATKGALKYFVLTSKEAHAANIKINFSMKRRRWRERSCVWKMLQSEPH